MFLLSILGFSFRFPCPSALREILRFKGKPLRSAVVTGIKCCTPNEEYQYTVYKFILSPHSMGLHVRLLQTQT